MAVDKHRLKRIAEGSVVDRDEAMELYENAPLYTLMEAAHTRRLSLHPDRKVGWIIDRNVNITNVCFSFCKFCNFCRKGKDEDAYITSIDEYRLKIGRLFELGGDQLLLQGGMHPKLELNYYCDLFSQLKAEFPDLKLHALGPPEVVHLSRMADLSYRNTLLALIEAGLDSLPGAGAEILVDRVRQQVSPGKCTADNWLEVMIEAHRLNLPTSATMMFGHVETAAERIDHLFRIRAVQDQVQKGHFGFLNFVPWPFMDNGTSLKLEGIANMTDARDYIRLIAISRLVLHNIPHIQASWLTVGESVAQICLHAGANDFGSIMIEENVVSSAGANNQLDARGIQQSIKEAGFIPYRRNQRFESFD